MTRSPLPRRTTWMRRVSPKRCQRDREWATLKQEAISAHGGRCRVRGCNAYATHAHHMGGRGEGRQTIALLLLCCAECHQKIHDEPAWAYANGYLVRRNEVLS